MFLLLSKEMSPKSKTLVNLESRCRNINVSILFIGVQEGQSFFGIVGTVEQIVRASLNFTFSANAEGVERNLKTVFKLVFSKMSYTKP